MPNKNETDRETLVKNNADLQGQIKAMQEECDLLRKRLREIAGSTAGAAQFPPKIWRPEAKTAMTDEEYADWRGTDASKNAVA